MMSNDSAPEKPLLLLPAPHTSPIRSTVGIVVLALLFLASASITAAYLSNLAVVPNSQTGAAAAAVENAFADIALTAKSAYVLDLTTGKVFYEKNADAQLPLASLTKVPLVLAVSEVLPASSILQIPPHQTPDGAGIRFPIGLSFQVQDIIDFTLVASSNEGASLLAEAASEGLRVAYPESVEHAPVLWRMNDLAKRLGLANTYFLNTTGLDLSPTQAGAFGSAKDMAHLFAHAASSSPASFGQTARSSIKIRATTGESLTAENTDEALPSIPG